MNVPLISILDKYQPVWAYPCLFFVHVSVPRFVTSCSIKKNSVSHCKVIVIHCKGILYFHVERVIFLLMSLIKDNVLLSLIFNGFAKVYRNGVPRFGKTPIGVGCLFGHNYEKNSIYSIFFNVLIIILTKHFK